MARGGYRAGSGRPKGSTAKGVSIAAPAPVTLAAPMVEESKPGGKPNLAKPADAGSGQVEPVEFCMSVYNDAEQPIDIRLRAAAIAAPFRHSRLDKVTASKKEAVKDAAEKAAAGKFAPGLAPKLVVNNDR